jgi:HK97 family phage portal protein
MAALSWLTNLFGKRTRAVVDAPSGAGSAQPALLYREGFGGMGEAQPTSTINELEFSWREAYFFSCLNVIATNAMAVPLVVRTLAPAGGTLRAYSPAHLRHAVKQRAILPRDQYAVWLRDKGLESVEVDDAHPLRALLDTPNPDADTWPEFVCKTFLHLVGTGDLYWELVGGANNLPPSALYLMQPDRVTIKRDKETWVGGYFYKVNGVDTPYAPEEVFHCRLPHPMNDLYGLSRADTLEKVLGLRWNAYRYNEKYFKNGAKSGGNWVPKPGTSLPEAELLRLGEILKMRVVGIDNMHKVGVLSQPMDWVPDSTPLKDMEFGTLIQQTEHDISGVVGVPRALTGRTSDVNRSNMDALKVLFWSGTMQPLFALLTAKMNSNVCPRYGPGLYVEPDYDGIAVLQEDADARSKRAAAGFDASFLSRNEAREQAGAEPLQTPDGEVFKVKAGDVFVPVGTDPQEELDRKREEEAKQQAEATARLEALNEAKQQEQPPQEGAQPPPGEPLLPGEERGVYPLYSRAFGDEEHQAEITAAHEAMRPFELALMGDLVTYIEHLEQETLAALSRERAFLVTRAASPDAVLFQPQVEGDALWNIVRANALKAAGAGALREYAKLESGLVFNMLNPAVQQYLNEKELVIKTIPAEWHKQLRAELLAGNAKGEPVSEITKRIEGVYGDMQTWQARRIAQTETVGAYNNGAYSAIMGAEVGKKRWVATLDDKVRDSHARMHGKVVGAKERFPNGLLHPGDPAGRASEVCNCRCCIVAQVETGAAKPVSAVPEEL